MKSDFSPFLKDYERVWTNKDGEKKFDIVASVSNNVGIWENGLSYKNISSKAKNKIKYQLCFGFVNSTKDRKQKYGLKLLFLMKKMFTLDMMASISLASQGYPTKRVFSFNGNIAIDIRLYTYRVCQQDNATVNNGRKDFFLEHNVL